MCLNGIPTIHSMSQVRRLYTYLKPQAYDIRLRVNPNSQHYSGRVTLEADMPRAQSTIRLHADGIEIKNAVVTTADSKQKPRKISYDASAQEVSLSLAKPIPAGRATLQLDLRGQIRDDMHGLYKIQPRGENQPLLATQLEAKHAREVFPCIDEPEAKAVFKLTLTIPKGLVAIANTPEASTEVLKESRRLAFEPTPKMSSYLLAFVVGDIGYQEATTSHGVVLRTYATPSNVEHTGFALEVAGRVLDFYNDYFDIPYPLPKLDLVALPDFAAGAMENWGLVTFREELLLLDPKNSSVTTKQWVAIVIAHELAHQWFGNLVTMRWWTDLWLNEGFASWIEYLAVDHLFPDWQVWTQFVANDYAVAQQLDSLASTHPVEVAVRDPAEIQQIFDAISYQKGASVIRMLHQYLGGQTFRKGLAYYLKKHAYGNAETRDLWVALEEYSKRPVVAFMDAWTRQPGYPLLTYRRQGSRYRVEQQLFRLNPKRPRPAVTWPIPLAMAGRKKPVMIDQPAQSIPAPKRSRPKLNVGETGFYRVAYGAADYKQLARGVADQRLGPEDRMGLIHDAWALAASGHIDTTDALKLSLAYGKEANAAVWQSLSSELAWFLRVFNSADDETVEELFAPHGLELIDTQLKRLGWQPRRQESHFDRLLRPQILDWAAIFKHPDVLKQVELKFHAHLHSKPIHPDLRRVVYTAVARNGGMAEYKQLLALFKAADSAEERARLAAGLTRFRNSDLVSQSLELIKTPPVRLPEVPRWLSALLVGRYSRELAWQWFQSNWDWVVDRFADSYHLGRFVKTCGEAAADDARAQEIKKFFASRQHPGIKRNVRQSIEIAELQAAWRRRDNTPVRRYLSR